jgi:hypothetical protein
MSSQLAERVTHIPELYEEGDKSTAVLLKEAGLPDADVPPSVPDIEESLQREPELADLWLERAHDQRFAGGWAIECTGNVYRIKNYASGQALIEANRLKACAEFIARYTAVMRDVMRRWH